MKRILGRLGRFRPRRHADTGRRGPGYLFGGHVRTSTVVLVILFGLVWWTYDTYRPEPEAPVAPQVVPPGFVPDPEYTWVPRTRLQRPPVTVTETVTPTPTTTETTPPPSEPETPGPPPSAPPFPFPLPPPFGPPPAETPPGAAPSSSPGPGAPAPPAPHQPQPPLTTHAPAP